ncbi:MAG: hypothetical protein ABI477_18855 [Chryseolinea sp.]
MKKVISYNSIAEAKASLDNGGRFYNVLSQPDDGVISKAEVAKVAGLFNAKQQMVLFLDLAISELEEPEKEQLILNLSNEFRPIYDKYKSSNLLPSEVDKKGSLSTNVIITGTPKLLGSDKEFKGFVMVSAGKTFMLIPIIDKYTMYEIRDDASSATFIIAHAKSDTTLPAKTMKVGGVLKQLKLSKGDEHASKTFLEATYFMDII